MVFYLKNSHFSIAFCSINGLKNADLKILKATCTTLQMKVYVLLYGRIVDCKLLKNLLQTMF